MLPKIKSPIFTLVLPSTGKSISFRPFTVKEEKILMIAKESNETKDVLNAFKQIVRNCILDDNIDVSRMPIFDLEYAFLMIRAKSSSNISQISIKDEDGQEYMAIVNLDETRIEKKEGHSKVIDLDGEVGVVMRYPTIEDMEILGVFNQGEVKADNMIAFIRQCIDEVFDTDNSYKMSNASEAERNEFFESLNNSYFEKIQNFFAGFPVIVADAEYKTADGTVKKQTIKGANNFL